MRPPAPGEPPVAAQRVIIVGAGSAGRLVAREIAQRARLGLVAVGFVDDDPSKLGARIEGLNVLGPCRELGRVVAETEAELGVLAMPSANGRVVREISSLCAALGFRLRTIPSLAEILSGTLEVSAVRDLDVSDLLRRSPIPIDAQAGEYLRGASVLVTGAGGSIGSEICRQVLRHDPSRLTLLDLSENALYEIDRQLRGLNRSPEIVPLIGNIRDRAKMHRVLKGLAPKVVFHAAAYKHIPLTEVNEDEAVLNIIFGTRNLLEAAAAASVQRFVLISTDKAVHPAGIMGACKRVAELLAVEAARRKQGCVVAVRFGNVLASSGSVVPLFREQIAAGGPVTVRHKEVERYFMTLQEASSLVVSAAALGEGGETFVLDMGAPVKVLSLAQDLIRLSGREPGLDIEITFTGLRPGEKIRESLFLESETAEQTRHPRIWSARSTVSVPPLASDWLEGLEALALSGANSAVRERLREFFPGLGRADETEGPVVPSTKDASCP